MAKVKFSALISEMRNKLNGSVFSKNRAGNYLRNKVTPVNPNTAAQSGVRAVFAALASGWRALTEAQRAAWNGAVNDYKSTDIFGDVKVPSGINLYQKLNLNLANAERPAIDTPAMPAGVDSVAILAAAIDASDETVDLILESAVPAGHVMVIESSGPVSPGINSSTVSGSKLTKADAGVTSPVDVAAAYIAKYGVPVAGQKAFFKVKFVNMATGQASPTQVVSCIVAA